MQIKTYTLYGDKRSQSEGVATLYVKHFYDHDCQKELLPKNSC